MHVMPARVHHSDIAPAVILGAGFARVGQSGFLFHRQRIKLRTQHDRGPRTILQNADHAGSTHVFRNFITERAQTIGQFGRRPRLMR